MSLYTYRAVAAKAISIENALAAAEEASTGVSTLDQNPLHGLYDPTSGAKITKRSRKGVCRQIHMRIAVDSKGTFLYWFSFMKLRKKKFNLSTLCEVVEHCDADPSPPLIIRLRNTERTLDFTVDSTSDYHVFSKFFNEFRR